MAAARDAGLVEDARVAADDLGHRFAPGFEPALIQRIGHGGDMVIEAPLRDQRAGEAGENDKREGGGQLQQGVLHGERRQHARGEQQPKRDPAVETPFASGMLGSLSRVEALEHRAHPHDRMPDAIEE